MDLMVRLLDLAKNGQVQALAAENLAQGSLLLLRKLAQADAEIRSLEGVLERKEAEEKELSELLLQQLQQLP
jgi:hypothetical protein